MTSARFQARLLELRNRYVQCLPDRVAAIVQTLRECQELGTASGVLDRQFHNLAGTAGTYGLFAIAATAMEGFDECVDLNGARIEGDARYLWSVVEELANEVCRSAHNAGAAVVSHVPDFMAVAAARPPLPFALVANAHNVVELVRAVAERTEECA